MDIKQALQTLRNDPKWLDRYLDHLDTCPTPKTTYDRHHILPKALFPMFASLKENPWNCAILRPGDHLLAHYYLFKALPSNYLAVYAFKLMVGKGLLEQVRDNEALVMEIAEAYEAVRLGRENSPNIKGWVHLYRGDEEETVAPTESVDDFLRDGWTTTPHPRPWVTNGVEDRRVKLKEVEGFLAKGYTLGRQPFHTAASRAAIAAKTTQHHERERAATTPYAFMPRGDAHHNRIFGVSDETKAAISAGLTGKIQSPETIAKRRAKLIGQKKPWKTDGTTAVARREKSEAMHGALNHWYGTHGPMEGKTHSATTLAKMSATHLTLNADPVHKSVMDASRPRGSAHPFYGKERDEAVRLKISQALQGQVQSDETITKRNATRERTDYEAIPKVEHNLYQQALVVSTEEELISRRRCTESGSRPYTILTGIMVIRKGEATEDNRKAWQQAATYIRLSGITNVTLLQKRDPSIRLGPGHRLTSGQIPAHQLRNTGRAKGIGQTLKSYNAITPEEHAAFARAWDTGQIGELWDERMNWPVRGRAYNILSGLLDIRKCRGTVDRFERWRQAGLWLRLSGRECPVVDEALELLNQIVPA